MGRNLQDRSVGVECRIASSIAPTWTSGPLQRSMLIDRVREDSKISDIAQHVKIRKEGEAQTG